VFTRLSVSALRTNLLLLSHQSSHLVRLEVIAKTRLPRPTLFHGIARIAERRPPGPMAAFLC